MFQCASCGAGLAAARQMPAQQLPGMAVNHQRQRRPAIPTRPDAAQIRRPALVRPRGHRRQCLDPGPEADGPLTDLPAHQLEHALHGVLVEPQQMRHRSIAKRRRFFDQRLDGRDKLRIELWRCLHRLVVDGAARHVEPAAQLGDRDGDAVGLQSLVDRLDHFSSSPSRDCNFFLARSSSIASP
ncbi:hypothetical protein D3C78_1210930 [compost metagenome]